MLKVAKAVKNFISNIQKRYLQILDFYKHINFQSQNQILVI